MAVTRGATLSTTDISANTTDGSITHTVDSGTTLLLVYIGTEGGESISGTPQWSLGGGEDLTLIDTFGASSNAADCIGHWYGRVSPTAGAGTVTITFASNVNPAVCLAANYLGTEVGTVAAATNFLSEDINDTATATNVHASAGNAGNCLVLGTHFQGDDGATPTDDASMFDVFNSTTGGSSAADFTYFWGDILNAAGATAVTVTYQATDENTGGYIELVAVAVGDITRSPGIGTLSATGQIPVLATGVQLPLGTLSLTGLTPTAVVNTTISIPVGSLILTGFAPPFANVDIAHFRWSDDDNASHELTTLLGSEDTSFEIPSGDFGTGFNLIVKIHNDGDLTETGNFQLQYNKDGGGWNDVNGASSNIRTFNGQDSNAAEGTPERLTATAQTFQVSVYNEVNSLITRNLPAGEDFEFYYCIEFRSADNSGGESYEFRIQAGGRDITHDVTLAATLEVAAIVIPVGVGSLTLAGQIPVAQIAITIAVPTGSLILTGFAPTVEISHVAVPATGTLVLTGEIPTLVQTDNHIRAPPVGTAIFSGSIPTINITQSIPIPLGSGVFTGFVPTVIQTFSIDVPVGNITASGFIPTLVQEFSIDVPIGSISVSGNIPTVQITAAIPIPAGSGVFTGFVPTVIQTFSIEIPVGSAVLTGLIPTILTPLVVSPSVGSIILSGQFPTVERSFVAELGTGSLTLDGKIPTVVVSAVSQTVTPDVGSLVATGFIPTAIINIAPTFGLFHKVTLAGEFDFTQFHLLKEDGFNLLKEDGGLLLIRSDAILARSANNTYTYATTLMENALFKTVIMTRDLFTSVRIP